MARLGARRCYGKCLVDVFADAEGRSNFQGLAQEGLPYR